MRVKQAIILFLLLFAIFINTGCKKAKENPPAPIPDSAPVSAAEKVKSPQVGEITDFLELEKLWKEYIYDAIPTVFNSRNFNSAKEIDPVNVAAFSWRKYVAEQGEESLSLVEKDSSLRLLPLETVKKYAKTYFDLDNLDVSNLQDEYYDHKKGGFIFGFGKEHERPSHRDNNYFGVYLDKVMRNSDGSVTVYLVRYDSMYKQRVELKMTYTLKQRADGSLYFVNGKWEYVNNNIVTLTGDYQRFDTIRGFEGSLDQLYMVDEAQGRLVLFYKPYERGQKAALMLVNPANMIVEKQLELKENVEHAHVKALADKYAVCLIDKVMIISKDLEHIEDISLPQVITDKVARVPKYNNDGFPDVFFGGYDISSDLKSFAYTDEIGLKLLKTEEQKERLLVKTVPIKGSQLIDRSYHLAPRFIAQESKIITTMTGYESFLGYTLYDLTKNEGKALSISWYGSTENIRFDTGLLEVNSHIYQEKEQKSEIKTLYLDFATGMVKELKILEQGETGDIRDNSLCYVGQEYAAFFTYTYDQDHANNMSYLNRVNLQTLAIESQIISVKGARTGILGVLKDGRVVFWYDYNPSEKGICITK